MLQTLSFHWLYLNKHFHCSQYRLEGYWMAATPSKRCGMSNTFRKTKTSVRCIYYDTIQRNIWLLSTLCWWFTELTKTKVSAWYRKVKKRRLACWNKIYKVQCPLFALEKAAAPAFRQWSTKGTQLWFLHAHCSCKHVCFWWWVCLFGHPHSDVSASDVLTVEANRAIASKTTPTNFFSLH